MRHYSSSAGKAGKSHRRVRRARSTICCENREISQRRTLQLLDLSQIIYRSPVSRLLMTVCLFFSSFFFYLFYVRYWKWRDCIEAAASSCITPEGDILIGGGAFWIVPAVVFFLLFAVIFGWNFWRKRRVTETKDNN